MKNRPTLTVLADSEVTNNIRLLNEKHGAMAVMLYLYLGRAAPEADQSGLFRCHPSWIAQALGVKEDAVRETLPLLAPHVEYDPATDVFWIKELAAAHPLAPQRDEEKPHGCSPATVEDEFSEWLDRMERGLPS